MPKLITGIQPKPCVRCGTLIYRKVSVEQWLVAKFCSQECQRAYAWNPVQSKIPGDSPEARSLRDTETGEVKTIEQWVSLFQSEQIHPGSQKAMILTVRKRVARGQRVCGRALAWVVTG